MTIFDNIREALQYTVTTLIPQQHTYIINVLGPKEAAENRATTIQIVAQHMIFEDRNCGLTLNVPFDTSSGEFTRLVEFMGSAIKDFCDEYEWDGIPCFALRFGPNVEVAEKAIRFVLAAVHGYTSLDGFKYEVHDEGVVEEGPQTPERPARFSAKHFGYFDDWKNGILTCPKCGWSGTFMQGSVGHYRELMDSSCPVCDYGETPMLAIVSYPTLEETEANFDRLSEQEKEAFAHRKQFVQAFQSSSLKNADQLPDLSEAQITLSWDFTGEEAGGSQTVIRHGEQVLWSEPATWEGYERFEQIVAMLKQRYGERLVDVVPTPASELYLYGDRLTASDMVERVRNGISVGREA